MSPQAPSAPEPKPDSKSNRECYPQRFARQIRQTDNIRRHLQSPLRLPNRNPGGNRDDCVIRIKHPVPCRSKHRVLQCIPFRNRHRINRPNIPHRRANRSHSRRRRHNLIRRHRPQPPPPSTPTQMSSARLPNKRSPSPSPQSHKCPPRKHPHCWKRLPPPKPPTHPPRSPCRKPHPRKRPPNPVRKSCRFAFAAKTSL